jgi:predicted KAP-like P-loop ATPase
MINWSALLAKFISMLMSWLDASNLRNLVYLLEEEREIMYTALEDIQRMDPEGHIGWYAKQTIDRIDGHE